MSLQDLPVSLRTGTLIAKDKEPNSKLGLCSADRNKLLSYKHEKTQISCTVTWYPGEPHTIPYTKSIRN